jgi:hypothetical protein
LSIIVINGATSTAAEAALAKSAHNRSPRFFVFHFRGSGIFWTVLGAMGGEVMFA